MSESSLSPSISVTELGDRLAEPNLQLIDVREPEELAIAQIDGFVNLPLSEFAEWSDKIQTRFNAAAETIVLCHHGVRSAQMCSWLHQQGFSRVRNVVGGIEQYAAKVDSSIPRY